MKFKGQVKIPELDSPGVPAVILIEDPQAELFVEGESLGRWSLVDVRAERLIANAFSLNLDGDEVTFIADDPIDFAYGGVDQMANVWARYKTMTLPRRAVATSRSRKGVKPSRIADLRSAIEETLSSPAPASVLPGLEVQAPPPPPAIEPVDEPAARFEPVPEPVVKVDPVPVVEPMDRVEPEQAPVIDFDEVRDQPEIDHPAALEPPRVISMGPTHKESIFKDVVPWAKKKQTEPTTAEPDGDVAQPVVAEPEAPPTAPVAKPIPKPEVDPEPVVSRPEVVAPPPKSPSSAPRETTSAEPVPWLDPSAAPPPGGPRHLEPAAAAAAMEPPTVISKDKRFVVDLGAFEEGAESPARSDQSDDFSSASGVPSDDVSPESRVPEPALSTASEKGGLMGAVRSAFVRSRDVHDHEYVSAPGGMGIVRNICAQCGHISIGVSE